jgi:hypothetical protein
MKKKLKNCSNSIDIDWLILDITILTELKMKLTKTQYSIREKLYESRIKKGLIFFYFLNWTDQN